MHTRSPHLYLFILLIALSGCNRQKEQANGYVPAQSMMPSGGQPPADTRSATSADPRSVERPADNSAETYRVPGSRPQAGDSANSGEERGNGRVSPFSPSDASSPRASQTVIPAGTQLRVRLEQSIDTKRNRPGDRFAASLAAPITIDGGVVAPVGTRVQGHLTEAKRSGRLKGRAVIGLELDSMQLNNTTYDLSTAADTRVSGRHRKRNLLFIGGGAGIGTLIGGLAGGPMAALAGAGAGAGAGTAGAFFTGKKDVRLPVETPLTFRLRRAVALN